MTNDQNDIQRVTDSLSSKYWSWKFLELQSCPLDLYSLFEAELPHIPLESWPGRFNWGGVFINGEPIFDNIMLKPPCRIEYYEPKYDYLNPAAQFPPFLPDYVLSNDGELAFIFKPAGIPCFQAREQRGIYLKGQLEEHFQCKIHMPSRLDTSVSGLMAISLKDRFHDQLQRVFEHRLIHKTYLLLTRGKPDWKSLTVDQAIGKDMRHPVLRKVVPEGGKPATTIFEFLGSGSYRSEAGANVEVSLLKASPITGRTHQIRIHASYIGMPILGDNFYGGEASPNLHLLSYKVNLQRPITKKEIDFKLPLQFVPNWVKNYCDLDQL